MWKHQRLVIPAAGLILGNALEETIVSATQTWFLVDHAPEGSCSTVCVTRPLIAHAADTSMPEGYRMLWFVVVLTALVCGVITTFWYWLHYRSFTKFMGYRGVHVMAE